MITITIFQNHDQITRISIVLDIPDMRMLEAILYVRVFQHLCINTINAIDTFYRILCIGLIPKKTQWPD